MITLTWLLFALLAIGQVKADCVWYGNCGKNNLGPLSCNYSGPAKALYDEEGLATLQRLCPQYYTGNGSLTCCDTGNLDTLSKNLAAPQQLIGRCPSCYRNMANLFCFSTCDPNMSASMRVTKTQPNNVGTVGDAVTEVVYHLSTPFADGAYNSCANVQLPAGNTKAMTALCGSADCNTEKWFEFMGLMDKNKQSPLDILFTISDNSTTADGLTPMNMTAYRCNEAVGDESACSCQDCVEACVQLIPVTPPQPFLILGMDGYFFIMLIIFIATCIAYAAIEYIHSRIPPKDFQFKDPESVAEEDDGKPTWYERFSVQMEVRMEYFFVRWGTTCATHPWRVICVSLLVAVALSAGILLFKVTIDPVELWCAPDSSIRLHKDYFDSHFGPFYRNEQVLVRNKQTGYFYRPGIGNKGKYYSTLFIKDFLDEVFALQMHIMTMPVYSVSAGRNITLQDICFQPLAPDNNNCAVQSIFNYFQNNKTNFDKSVLMAGLNRNYLDHLQYCTGAPASINDQIKGLGMSCLADYGGPIFPYVVLGGYSGSDYMNATALSLTFVVNNTLDKDSLLMKMALEWETAFIQYLLKYNSTRMSFAFNAERSVQDELERQSRSDVLTIALSYVVMFAYVAVMLGRLRRCDKHLLVELKVSLGLIGVVIVLFSVAASLGTFGYVGVPATLIVFEVIPMLVLAVGVDNIFIVVQSLQRDTRLPGESLEEQIGRILGRVGPSMLLSSVAESATFFLGAMTTVPAVRSFALYAGAAVFYDFLLQITAFLAFITLDARRTLANRIDLLCCFKVEDQSNEAKRLNSVVPMTTFAHNEVQSDEYATLETHEVGCCGNRKMNNGMLYYLFKEYVGPFILHPYVRPFVIVLFAGWLCVCIALIPTIRLGLEQELSMPLDSYELVYFQRLKTDVNVGPPVYFVVGDGLDYTNIDVQNYVCGSSGCQPDSLLSQIYDASLDPYTTMIASPASSWLDDYFDWLRAGNDDTSCCKVHTAYSNLTSPGDFCPSFDQQSTDCIRCNVTLVGGRPIPSDFMTYLPFFLKDNPNTICSKGGHAAYGAGVNLINNQTAVGSSYFMAYQVPPYNISADYTRSLQYALELSETIANTITDGLGLPAGSVNVFPYSVTYVYFEQYLHIVYDTVLNLSLSILLIFLITFVLLGLALTSALFVTITIVTILISMFGLMALWEIDLNAVSLVNLVMAIGIGVEFCAHTIRAFMTSPLPTTQERAFDAFTHMGSSVFSGITLTKIGGIIVLSLATSQLFQVFYFRMYLGIVIFGAAAGLVLLPVLLSFAGPSYNARRMNLLQEERKKRNLHVEDQSVHL